MHRGTVTVACLHSWCQHHPGPTPGLSSTVYVPNPPSDKPSRKCSKNLHTHWPYPNLSGPLSLSLLLARSHSLSYLALALAHSRTLSLYKSMFVRGLLFEVFTHTHTHTHTHTNSLNQIHIRTNPPSLLLQACTLTLRLVRPFPCICGVLHDKASPSGNEVIPPTVRV